MKPPVFGFLFLLFSFAGLRIASAVGPGVEPALVPAPDTFRVVPRAQLPEELAKDFDARLAGILNILNAERDKKALSPDQYNQNVAIINQVAEGKLRLMANQNGVLTTEQLDALNRQLEQVEEQIQQSFVE